MMTFDPLDTDSIPQSIPLSHMAERVVTQLVQSHDRPIPTTSNTPQRQNPWRRIGRSFKPTSDAQEALQQSGLDWSVEKVGLRTNDLTPVPNVVGIQRSDNKQILGVVGSDYQPLQNAEAFDFFRELAGEARITFETAGEFDNGAITWVQARLPDLNIRIGDDVSESFLFISNGNIGNKPLTIAPTTMRIICRNSLRMAEAQHGRERQRRPSLEAGFVVRHTKGMKDALRDIQEAYAQTVRSHAATRQAYEYLANKRITDALTNNFIKLVFESGTGPDESERAKTIQQNRREQLAAILASPTSNVKGTAGSAFSLFQAAVEYIDHDRLTRTGDQEDATEKRMLSATFGTGHKMKSAAFSAILALTHA